jgi:hypothetical protein
MKFLMLFLVFNFYLHSQKAEFEFGKIQYDFISSSDTFRFVFSGEEYLQISGILELDIKDTNLRRDYDSLLRILSMSKYNAQTIISEIYTSNKKTKIFPNNFVLMKLIKEKKIEIYKKENENWRMIKCKLKKLNKTNCVIEKKSNNKIFCTKSRISN